MKYPTGKQGWYVELDEKLTPRIERFVILSGWPEKEYGKCLAEVFETAIRMLSYKIDKIEQSDKKVEVEL